MTEFTKEWIKNWRLINYPIKGKDTIKKYWFNEALNYIETQNERIAELEQERRWIPVSERLPEDSRIYDVAIAGYEYSWTGTCVFGKWIGETGKPLLGVTHWKYRPQPPKEEV